ncbi:hypothetical protein WJX72_001261 [[Myrmecia] bisecta]|uniref:Uncharacterized protein n=1 Tax=[Myrmecia] bisecta TaxID=41462 RepID=A0AAW1PGU9_9CHLO
MEEDALLESVIEFHSSVSRLSRHIGQPSMVHSQRRLTSGDYNVGNVEMEHGTVDASLCTACHKGNLDEVKALM